MLDLGNMSVALTCCPSFLPSPEALAREGEEEEEEEQELVPMVNGIQVKKGFKMEDHVKDWVKRRVASGVSESRCVLPFLLGSKKLVDCLVCNKPVYQGERLLCSVRSCQGAYHLLCVRETLRFKSKKKFKCPLHDCFLCKQQAKWRCVKCPMAAHDKHAPWPELIRNLENQPGKAICWRHSTDWREDRKNADAQSEVEDIFSQLPLPYVEEEFKLDLTVKCPTKDELPPPYVHIRRNVYLVKKKRDDAHDGVGCTNCGTICCRSCVCRNQSISCSKSCGCPETCSNRPFRKEKKIRIVKTELCGWGVETAEPIDKEDFIVEYIGEVISDAECEKRLWDMKGKGMNNFYMCEIQKDFTIDATFKGNASRFLNHSCNPNCVLEKWQVEGEIRIGVFAAREIEAGEPLTYDYRFVQFGPEVKCNCGSENCQGNLGTKRKEPIPFDASELIPFDASWGTKRRRVVHRHRLVTHKSLEE